MKTLLQKFLITILISSLIVILSNNAKAQYCIPDFGEVVFFDDYIDRFVLEEVDNTSGSGAEWNDFTALSATLIPGNTYTLTIYGPNTDEYNVWIDYDQNEIFETDERLAMVDIYFFPAPSGTITFTVPLTALTGSTLLRVFCGYIQVDNIIDPCNISPFTDIGEVEDYSVNINAPSGGSPAIEWAKNYGATYVDEANVIHQTDDGGYIVAGYTASVEGAVGNLNTLHGSSFDYGIIKLNSSGDATWTKVYGGFGDDYAYDIKQTSDGGYIVAGNSNSTGDDVHGNHGSIDCWILKLNSFGDTIWTKSLGGDFDDYARSVMQTSDGGYFIAGYTYSNNEDVSGHHNPGGGTDCWVVKLDATGNLIWTKALGGTGSEYLLSSQQTTEGGYIVAGFTGSIDGDISGYHGGEYDYWVVKLNASGDITWAKTFGGSQADIGKFVEQTSDGGYLVSGTTISNNGDVSGNHGAYDMWVLKLDDTGNIVWQNAFGGTADEEARASHQTSDGGYIIAGHANSNNFDVSGNHGDRDYWIIRLNTSGDTIWTKSLGGSYFEIANSIEQTSDCGFIVAGFSASINGDVTDPYTGADYWIVKLESNGSSQTFYADTDGDSFGDATSTIEDCSAPAGYVSDSTDCDDANNLINPAATEIPGNGIDENCDGIDPEINNNALDFDGADDYVDLGMNSENLTSEFTLEGFFKIDETGAHAHHLISKSSYFATSITNFPIHFGWSSGRFYMDLSSGDDYSVDAEVLSDSLSIDTWYHVAAVYKQNEFAALYIDGILVDLDSLDFSISSSVQPWVLGRVSEEVGGGIGQTQLNGVMDEVRIWNVARTDSEIANNACELNGILPTSLIAYYKFDQGTANGNNTGVTTLIDETDNNYDGTLNNFSLNSTSGNWVDGLSSTPFTFFADLDNDGFGDATNSIESCITPSGYVSDNTDCDDTNSLINSTATEVCNLIDDDCDGFIDEGGELIFYADSDEDGFGDAANSISACIVPTGYVSDNTDCDDDDATVHTPQLYYLDNDGDGYGSNISAMLCSSTAPTGYSTNNTDCSDNKPLVHEFITVYADEDGDSYGDPLLPVDFCRLTPPSGYVFDNTDCNDFDNEINPSTIWFEETDGDGFSTGNTFVGCNPPSGYVLPSEVYYVGNDCNDINPDVNPDAAEICNEFDDDCDGEVDFDDPSFDLFSLMTWFYDGDGDGFGNSTSLAFGCYAPVSYVAQAGDCNNTNSTIYPNAPEICDGLDNDCDGLIDSSDPNIVGQPTWYADDDGDGYGDPSDFLITCFAPGYVSNSDDCDDTNSAKHTGATDICDDIDNDCDGATD
ncbi:MAG: hypothetical protein H7Y00_14190, partial [Fimbriimonadaceae bacterium]|nr:hypothetical protein [Chitinophagales bacterium]